ncbi:MAG: MFS transporter, partial [Chloroflexota bacterium]
MTTTITPKQTASRWNWGAVAAVFFIHGATYGNAAPRLPDLQAGLGLSEAQLGLALTGGAIGVVVALPLTGGVIARLGSRTATVIGGAAYALALIPIAL